MIVTGNVYLCAWREGDIPHLLLLRNDAQTQLQLMTHPRPSSAASVRDWLVGRSTQSDTVLFIIARQADDRVLGCLQLTKIDLVNRHAALGICLAPADQGQGHGQAAYEALLSYARRALNLRKITLEVLADSERAIQLYQKLSFRKIGQLAEHCLQDQCWHDAVLMERMLSP